MVSGTTHIRYISLSDLHFGAENSLLTSLDPEGRTDPHTVSPVLRALMESLRQLLNRVNGKNGPRPTLILNGDILEMAAATTNQAIMVFEHFLQLAFPEVGEDLFQRRVIFLPGNHDHHVWEMARETQYNNYVEMIPPGSPLDFPFHSTNLFYSKELLLSRFLAGIIGRYKHMAGVEMEIFYPGYGVRDEAGERAVVFHHGHFTESMYYAMTDLRTFLFPDRTRPSHIWDIEAENFAWIDFFWSALGRSGEVGADIDLLYNKLQDTGETRRLIYDVILHQTKRNTPPSKLDLLKAKAISWLANRALLKKMQNIARSPRSMMTDENRNTLDYYCQAPLKEQVERENGKLPRDLTLVLGHTHKPWRHTFQPSGYSSSVELVNSGGWVVDSRDFHPLHGGGVVLVSEEFETVLLRAYNESARDEEYVVGLQADPRQPDGPLYHIVQDNLEPGNEPWSNLSRAICRKVKELHFNLLRNIAR